MNSKPCDFCKETSCIASGQFDLDENTSAFVAVRLDMDFNQIDAEFGTVARDGSDINAEWSSALDIKYCPMCGRLLLETDYM